MHKAVLFDLDGTLTDTLADIAAAMNRALRLHSLPEWTVDDYRYLAGNGARTLSERCVRGRQDLAPSVLQTYQAYYETHNLVQSKPYGGIPDMLKAMADMGLTLTVLSNKPDADTKAVVRHFFPEVPFAVVRGQVEGVPVKPDPAGALAIARELNILPEEFLYLGDTDVDMCCARAAGMHPVGVLWGFRKEDELRRNGAEYIAAHPSEVLQFIQM